MKNHLVLSLLLILAVIGTSVKSISQERPAYLTVTTIHWNPDFQNFSMDDWKAVEKEYFDKVTSKNEYIMSSLVLMHYFTADNSEMKIVTGYRSWDDIEKAQQRSQDLEKAGWPDEAARKAFFKKESAYYTNMHSDEIYSTVDGAKVPAEKFDKPMVYYVRVTHRAFPEDGTSEEMKSMRMEYIDNVIDKNDYLKAYYPSRHAWGSNGQDFIEAFVVESLADLQSALEENGKLFDAHWSDKAKREEYAKKRRKYFEPWHGDFIYRSVPELTK